jgi:arabinofuranan 3-O-arabinosyltransferase
VRVEGAPAEGGRQITVAEVEAGSIDVRRSLVLPTLPASWRTPDAIVLRALDDARTGCATVALAVRCSAERARVAEEPEGMSRVIPLVDAREYAPEVTVRARPGEALEQLLQRDQLVNISASSVGVPDARGSAIAAIDGDPTTTWYAGAEDGRPSLSLSWVTPKRVTGVRLKVARDVAARAPRRITLVWPGGTRSVELDDRGAARIDPIRTDQLEILVDSAEQVESLGFDGSYTSPPIGVTELRLSGVPYVPLYLSPVPLRYGCGTGPTLRVNGTTYDTAVEAVPRDLFEMKSVPARVCKADGLKLWPGDNHVEVVDSDVLAVDTVVLDGGLDSVSSVGSPRLTAPSPSERVVAPPAGGADVVVVRENTNPGWHATQGGSAVRPMVADGWQQGWTVSPDGGQVRIDFPPDTLYRGGLVLGVLGLLGLLAGVLLNRPARVRQPGLSGRRIAPSLLLGLALAGGGLLAGTLGACVVGGSIIVGLLLRRRDEEAAAWLLAGAVLLAAGAYAFRPWGDSAGWAGSLRWPHYLALVSLAGALLMVLEDRPRMPGRLRRMLGRSTTR